MSIKKKFATAVATAGLLAGLFGSALVPTVSAARGDLDAPKVALTKWRTGISNNAGDRFENYDNWTKTSAPGYARITFSTFTGDREVPDNDQSVGFKLRDADRADITVANLSAVSSNPNIQVAFAYDADEGARTSCESGSVADAFGSTDSVAAVEDGQEYTNGHWNDGWYALCFKMKNDMKPGTSTVTVTANGVKLQPIIIKALGDIASLTLTSNVGTSPVIAADNQAIAKAFTMIAKDSAGQVINGTSSASSMGHYDPEDWVYDSLEPLGYSSDDVVLNQKGEEVPHADWFYNGTVSATASADKFLNIRRNTCQSESFAGAGDGDAGESYKIGFEIDNYDGDTIESNTITVTCSGSKDEYTVSSPVLEYTSGAADWAASSVAEDDLDGVIGIYVTVKDADGKPMGLTGKLVIDSYNPRTDPTLGFGVELDDYSALNVDYVDPRVGADGKVMIGYIVPDVTAVTGTVFPIDVTLSDWDANYDGTAALADLKKTLTYTVGSSTAKVYSATKAWSKAHTKVVVSVAWGAVCSNAMVTFDIEKGNGDMILVPIRRRANAAGTATLTLEKRKTVNYVTAISCTGLGSTEVGPVKARFK